MTFRNVLAFPLNNFHRKAHAIALIHAVYQAISYLGIESRAWALERSSERLNIHLEGIYTYSVKIAISSNHSYVDIDSAEGGRLGRYVAPSISSHELPVASPPPDHHPLFQSGFSDPTLYQI